MINIETHWEIVAELQDKIVYNIFVVQSLKGLPGASVNVPTTSDYGSAAPLSTIPGSENEFKQDQRPFARVMLILNIVLCVPLATPNGNRTLAGCRLYSWRSC
jgi:hypothetical protein